MPDTAVVSVAVAAASCASAVLSSSGVAMLSLLKNLFDEKFERVSADSWSSRPEIINN